MYLKLRLKSKFKVKVKVKAKVKVENEEREKVRSFIAQLSKNYREVLVRHFIHGQNLQSIAEELDINTNTVKSRLNAARMNLKSQMEKKEMEKFPYKYEVINTLGGLL